MRSASADWSSVLEGRISSTLHEMDDLMRHRGKYCLAGGLLQPQQNGAHLTEYRGVENEGKGQGEVFVRYAVSCGALGGRETDWR